MKQFVYSPESLGSAMKRARQTKKLTQQQAGQPFKLEQSTISNIENGTPGTQIETLFRLLAALDLEMVIQNQGYIQLYIQRISTEPTALCSWVGEDQSKIGRRSEQNCSIVWQQRE